MAQASRRISAPLLPLLLLAACAASLSAQAVYVLSWPNGSQTLNQGWCTQAGDNPQWANPGFDDSSWPAISLAAPNDYTGRRWYRLRLQLPAQHPPLALLVMGGGGTYEVYVNGKRLPGPELRRAVFVSWPRSQLVPLPMAAGSTTIALRTFIPPSSMFVADPGAFRVAVGTVDAIRNAHRSEQSARFDHVAPGVSGYLVVLFAGIPFLFLFWYQSDHSEYLWIGCYLVADALGAVSYELAVSGLAPFSLNWFISTPANYVMAICQIQFTFSFVGQRVPRGWRIFQAVLLAYPACFLMPAWLGYLSRGFFDVGEIVLLVAASVGMPILLLLWVRRGNREAGWIIFPSILALLTIALTDVGIVGGYLGLPRIATIGTPLNFGPFAVQIFEIADLLFVLAIGVVMFFRFTRVSREQARSAAELDAAREIQQRLVPFSLPAVPGCRLQAAYVPAEEVGGDFYQVLEQPGGSTLVVIGDVSGKGLKAAMTGTLALGALRTLAVEGLGPAALLTRLNQQLISAQDGGFVTCLCARITPDGAVALANAGHLAPYRCGDEIPLPPGLPLGVTPDADYAEITVQLSAGDALTFLSDGVVEAQSSIGELFGFDRTRAISGQAAASIARTAQHFGQQDDITVLTLEFTPAEAVVP
ncbi:MAG TPA: SpoIIE family protein phosphatase [Acidobacteriaceae bacterium]|nr:SpoIIE family protein phosphatase [Acidobacteriaceae bacterium]